MTKDIYPREKNWKHLYLRSNKVHRARQLGFSYPRESESKMVERESLNVLFICSMNQWRSPTAEQIYADKPLLNVRSRGTNRGAKRTVTSNDLKWADIVMVMEQKHKQRLTGNFPGEMRYQEIHVLDIPDDYQFMDPELIVELANSIDAILNHISE